MINETPDLFGGAAAQGELEGEQPGVEDSLGYGHLLDSMPQMDATPVQTAGGFGSVLGRILNRPVTSAVKSVLPAGVKIEREMVDSILRDAAKARVEGARSRRVDLEAQRQGGTPPVPIAEGAPSPRAATGTSGEINLDRAHPGAPEQKYPELMHKAQQDPSEVLRLVRTADELGDILDVIGEGMHEAPRTHASIREDGFDYDAVAQALTQDGLANDRQLFAVRSLIATIGDKVAVLARRIYQNSQESGPLARPRSDMLLQYEQYGQQLIALVKFAKGQTREVARALSQQQMVADTLSGNDLRALEAALNASTGGNPKALIDSASALAKQLDMGVDPATAFTGMMERHTAFEAVVELWKANNLSGFATQGNNAISSPIIMFAETAARAGAAAIGETRHALGIGSPEYYSALEFKEALIGGLNGVRHSLGFFWHALTTGETQLGAYGGKEIGSSALYEQFSGPTGLLSRIPGLSEGISPNVSEAVLTPAFRIMKSVDEAMMLPGYMAELSGLAARNGIFEHGLSGEHLRRHVDRLVMNPTYEMQQDALEAARKNVMQASSTDPGAGWFTMFGEVVHRAVKGAPIFQFVLPWIKTPARIMDYTIESSVLAIIQPNIYKALLEGGPKADIAAAKVGMGMAYTALMYPLVASMQVTGEGPEDPEQRAALERKGWKPFSFKVGNYYVSYRNWADPVIGSIAGMATALERARFARNDTDGARELMTGATAVFEYMLNQSYVDGFKRFMDATQNSGTWASYVGSIAQGFVPYGGAVSSAARIVDQTDRTRSKVKSPGFGGEGYIEDLWNGVKEDFRIRFPFMRDTVRPARYWDGDVKVPEGPEVVRHLLPMDMRRIEDDPASEELIKHGVKISEPRSRYDFGTKLIQLELLDLDNGRGMVYDDFIKKVGEERRKAVEIIINSYRYKSADTAMKGLLLDQAIAYGANAGEQRFIGETLKPIIESGELGGFNKSATASGLTLQQFVQLLLTQQGPRAIVPQSRREIELPPALEFK